MSDTGLDTDRSYSEVVRRKGKSGGGRSKAQVHSAMQIPGALGLIPAGYRGTGDMGEQQQLQTPGGLGLIPAHRGLGVRQQQQQQQRHYTSDFRQAYPKVITRKAGIRQVNCCSINLSNVKTGPRNMFPTDKEVSDFLIDVCQLDIKDLTKMCAMRNGQEFWVSFKNEQLASEFEEKLIQGIDWCGTIVNGRRLDIPTIHVKLRGAADDIGHDLISEVMNKFGKVASCRRGTAHVAHKYPESHPNWIWDGIWHVMMKPDEAKVIPSYILCDEDH